MSQDVGIIDKNINEVYDLVIKCYCVYTNGNLVVMYDNKFTETSEVCCDFKQFIFYKFCYYIGMLSDGSFKGITKVACGCYHHSSCINLLSR